MRSYCGLEWNGEKGGRLSDWSDAAGASSAVDEGAVGQVIVDVLVGVDVPLGDVHAHPHRGVDLGGIGVGERDRQHGPTVVVGFSAEADGQDVGRLQLGLGRDESVGFPDVGYTFAGHIVGGLEWHGDGGHRSGFVHESNIGLVGVKIQGYWATCRTGF